MYKLIHIDNLLATENLRCFSIAKVLNEIDEVMTAIDAEEDVAGLYISSHYEVADTTPLLCIINAITRDGETIKLIRFNFLAKAKNEVCWERPGVCAFDYIQMDKSEIKKLIYLLLATKTLAFISKDKGVEAEKVLLSLILRMAAPIPGEHDTQDTEDTAVRLVNIRYCGCT